jgi:transcription-repair coupling factor (superfamily II helicase)
MRDLEIRGAGNLLGAEQSGQMEAVGYDLYCKMLNEAVKEAKGIAPQAQFETSIDVAADAFIPSSYISNELQKLDIYKRIAGVEADEEADEMLEELIDRFGEPPKSVLNLLTIACLKAKAHTLYIREVTQKQKEITLVLYEKAMLDPAKIPELIQALSPALRFVPDSKNPYFLYTMQANSMDKSTDVLVTLSELLTQMERIRL